MKYLFLIITSFIVTCGITQTPDPLRNYFLQKKLITASQFALYDTFVEQTHRSTIEAYEEALHQAKTKEEKNQYSELLEKLKRTDTRSSFLPLSAQEDTLRGLMNYLISSCRGSINFSALSFSVNYGGPDTAFEKIPPDSLTAFLSSLHTTGLISALTAERTKPLIASHNILDSFSVVMQAIEKKELEAYYAPERVKEFLDTLLKHGIIKKAGADRIMTLAVQNQLTEELLMLAACEKAVVVNLNDYPDKPDGYMLPLYQKMSSLLPELSFTDFSVKVESHRERYDTGLHYETIVSLINNGRKYAHRDFYSPGDYDEDGHPDHEWKMGDYIETIFNKILRDKQSEYRIYKLERHLSGGSENDAGRLGFIALARGQEDLFQYSSSYFRVRHQNFSKGITSQAIDSAIQLYRQIGLLNHLTEKEIDSCIKAISEKEISYYSDILSSFKNLVFEIDLEYGVDNGQYKSITKKIAKISKGYFSPTGIIDTYHYKSRKSFTYGFTLNGKKYATTLKQEDDWLDTGFWDLITRAMKEQNKKGQFYYLYPAEGMRQIYLTGRQAEILKQRKMIELDAKDAEDE